MCVWFLPSENKKKTLKVVVGKMSENEMFNFKQGLLRLENADRDIGT